MFRFRKKQSKVELQKWHVYLALAVLFIALVLGVVQKIQSWQTGEVYEEYPALNKWSCVAAGGVWNECGSACRGQEDEEVCIELCVEQCACERDAQCPFGFTCEEFINGTGICLEDSVNW